MKLFLTDFMDSGCIEKYDSKFDTEEIAPWPRRTVYFPGVVPWQQPLPYDMALSIFPHLISPRRRRKPQILTPPQDTGKAAMAGFADAPGPDHRPRPKDGASKAQELMRGNPEGRNTSAWWPFTAVPDDAQTSEEILGTRICGRFGLQIFIRNSINIGRLKSRIVYYVYAYAKLFENGEMEKMKQSTSLFNSATFGNIHAYFKDLTRPICASNYYRPENDHRHLRQSGSLFNSLSMDILTFRSNP